MKTIIAGSRGVTSLKIVENAVSASGFTVTEEVSGGARGVDTLGEQWAKNRNIPVKRFPAEWAKYGRSAGYKRNVQMGDYAEALVAVWVNKSKGTGHMIDIAKKRNLKVFVVELSS